MNDLRSRIPICPHGTVDSIDPLLVLALEKLEYEMKIKLQYNSGYRCVECNAAAGGVKNSAHLRGKAVDVVIHGSGERFWLVSNAVRLGWFRIGIGRNFVHLDIDSDLPDHVMWVY